MKIRIVADSSANLFELDGVDFVPAPLKIITAEKEYVDDPRLDVPQMLEELSSYRGKSGTSCPNVGDWLEAFGDADIVYGAALTSKISGGFNAARMAAEEYTERHPERRVFILDSLTTGPELELLVERYRESVLTGLDFDAVCADIQAYRRRTHLMFSLESLQNFVNNGRVLAAVAAVARLLGICVVGQASIEGDLQPLYKRRGRDWAVRQIWKCMQEAGFSGGKVRIRHSENEPSAKALADLIRAAYPDCAIQIGKNNGLCSYYAEKGGVLVGFEGAPKKA